MIVINKKIIITRARKTLMKRIKITAFILRQFVSYFSPFEVLKALEFYSNEKFYMGINILESPSKPVML